MIAVVKEGRTEWFKVNWECVIALLAWRMREWMDGRVYEKKLYDWLELVLLLCDILFLFLIWCLFLLPLLVLCQPVRLDVMSASFLIVAVSYGPSVGLSG